MAARRPVRRNAKNALAERGPSIHDGSLFSFEAWSLYYGSRYGSCSASRLALPPTAAVLTVTVCSCVNRAR